MCGASQFCVTTLGGLCTRLPPPGGHCPDGCRLTKTCCNCPAYACFGTPHDRCDAGATCACLDSPDADIVVNCPITAGSCAESTAGVAVTCVLDSGEYEFGD